ncbi:hypothetical protein [Kitasatospora sp. NPDC088351]
MASADSGANSGAGLTACGRTVHGATGTPEDSATTHRSRLRP